MRSVYGLGHVIGGRTSEDVAGVVYDRYVLTVQNVESLALKLHGVALAEPDSARQPQVHVEFFFARIWQTASPSLFRAAECHEKARLSAPLAADGLLR